MAKKRFFVPPPSPPCIRNAGRDGQYDPEWRVVDDHGERHEIPCDTFDNAKHICRCLNEDYEKKKADKRDKKRARKLAELKEMLEELGIKWVKQ